MWDAHGGRANSLLLLKLFNRACVSFYHTIAPGQTDAVSFIYPISAVQSMLNGMTRIKAGITAAQT